MKSALITGGQGYIGNNLTEHLLKSNWFVSTLDSQFNHSPKEFPGYTRELRRYVASTTNADSVQRAMDGVGIVFHLATRHDWSTNYRHPMRICQSNVQGLATALSMARKSGINKVVYISSWQVYGNIVGAKETDSPMPVNMYAATHMAAEAICRGFYETGMDIVILRIAEVWGKDGHSIIDNIVAGNKIQCHVDEDQSRDFICIDDVTKAIKFSADWDSAIYNIGTGEEVSLGGVCSILDMDCEFIGYQVGYDEPFKNCLDVEFTKQRTGWEAKTKLSELDGGEIKRLCQG